MNKKRILIKIGIIVFVIVLAVAVPLLIGLFNISAIDLEIRYPENSIVLNEKDVNKELFDKYGDFKKYRRNQINTQEIENFLENMDFVEHAVVSVSMTGILRITVFQKYVIVRVYNAKGQQFYIDDNMFVVNSQNTDKIARCIIFTGDIKERPYGQIDTIKFKDCYILYKLAKMINKDKLLREWIAGIRKNKKQWYLLPSQGDYVVTLGEMASWEEELNKFHYLIEYSFKPKGWADYDNIDLRFHNQAVCSKKVEH